MPTPVAAVRRLGAIVLALVLFASCGLATRSDGGKARAPDAARRRTPPEPVAVRTLRWSPPELSDPRVVSVSRSGGTLELDREVDYRVVFPDETVTGQVTVDGGHNVVIVGGAVTLDADTYQAALKLENWAGTMHVEGLRLDPSGGRRFTQDAIRVNNKTRGAIAQLQNIWVEEVHGTRADVHGDILQTWAGPDVLRVDRFTGWGGYQGFFLAPEHYWDDPSPWQFRRTDLHTEEDVWKLWVMSDQNGTPPAPSCVSCWADTGPDPQGSDAASDDTFRRAGVRHGSPPGGPFAGTGVGVGYTSPGYAG